jgi:hypothetical protein
MMMFQGPIVAFFLMLVATSAAVVGSMIVLALLDLVFGKKSTPSLVADVVENNDQPAPPAKLQNPVVRSKPKIKALGAPGGGYRTKRKPTPGYGCHTQRVIHFDDGLDGTIDRAEGSKLPSPPSLDSLKPTRLA